MSYTTKAQKWALLTLFFHGIMAFAQSESSILEAFFRQYNPCTVNEFNVDGTAFFSAPLPESMLTPQSLRNMANLWSTSADFKTPNSSSNPINEENRYQTGVPIDASMSAILNGLATILEANGIDHITFKSLAEAANTVFQAAKTNQNIGACFRIHHAYGFSYIREDLSLSMDQVHEIDEVWNNDISKMPKPFSRVELPTISSGELSRDEALELRALRDATSLFGQMSPLKDNWAGWLGTLASGLKLKENQVDCVTSAMTFRDFVEQMISRGWLRDFTLEKGLGFRIRDWTKTFHVGVVLKNKRTQKQYILDSWMNGAAKPARIFRFSDWVTFRDHQNLVSAPLSKKPTQFR